MVDHPSDDQGLCRQQGPWGERGSGGTFPREAYVIIFPMSGCWVSALEFRLLGYRALWGLWVEDCLSSRARAEGEARKMPWVQRLRKPQLRVLALPLHKPEV